MATAEPYILFELAGTAYAVHSAAVQRMEMVEQRNGYIWTRKWFG